MYAQRSRFVLLHKMFVIMNIWLMNIQCTVKYCDHVSYCFGNISLDTPMVNLGGSIGFYRNPSSLVIINQLHSCTIYC